MGNEGPTTIEERSDPQRPPPAVRLPRLQERRSFAWVWLLIVAALVYAGYTYFEATKQKQQAAQANKDAKKGARVGSRGGGYPRGAAIFRFTCAGSAPLRPSIPSR